MSAEAMGIDQRELISHAQETRDGRMLVPTRPGLGLSLSEQVKGWTAQSVEIGQRP